MTRMAWGAGGLLIAAACVLIAEDPVLIARAIAFVGALALVYLALCGLVGGWVD